MSGISDSWHENHRRTSHEGLGKMKLWPLPVGDASPEPKSFLSDRIGPSLTRVRTHKRAIERSCPESPADRTYSGHHGINETDPRQTLMCRRYPALRRCPMQRQHCHKAGPANARSGGVSGHAAATRDSSARKSALAFSYRGATMVLTAADALSGWPDANGGSGLYSRFSWIA